jgi:hypothetical protein
LSTSITVSTELKSEADIVLHAQFLAALLAQRTAPSTPVVAPPVTPPPVVSPSAPETNTSSADVVADISPASVERQFRTFAAAKGADAARALLTKYNAPYLKDVPTEQLPAFVAELGQ